MQELMARNVTVQLRLSPEEASLLDQLARKRGRTKSDVLRDGLQRIAEGQALREKRRRNMHLLIDAAEAVPGDDARFRGRP